MKYFKYFLSASLIMISAMVMADTVKVNSLSMLAGEEKQFAVELDNKDNVFVSCQFDIVVPQGFSIPDGGISLSEERCGSHQFSFVQISDGKYRVMLYSMPVKSFSGNCGSIARVTLKCDNTLSSGSYTVSLVSQKFTDDSGRKHVMDDCQFSVAIEKIILKANSYSRKYGDGNPAFDFVTDHAIDGEPEIICEATASSPVGTYPIRILKGSVKNSNVSFVDGELTITEAPLTIKADNKQIVQGEPLPELTVTYEGFKNGENQTALSKLPSLSCSASADSAPGEYEINVKGAEAKNYDIQYVKGILTIVEPQAIVVTVKDSRRKYGDLNPIQYEYVVEGGELKGEPAITCDATPTSPVGTYKITIEKGTVENYNVSFVSGNLYVEKAPVTITADDKQMKIGDEVPALTATYSGFKNGEDQSVLTKVPEFVCKASSTSAGGEYPILVMGAEADNYDFVYETGILTIVDPPLVVTVATIEREYGDENPSFNYSVEGGRLIGIPELLTEATKESPVGNYAIDIKRGSILNANVTYVPGKLTITKAALTIVANDITIAQGEKMPTFTASYQGFKLKDNESSLDKRPVFACETDNSSQIGEYIISVSGAESKNYNLSYVQGTLKVIEAPVVVRVKDIVRLYGDENPAFEYTVEGGKLNGVPVVSCQASSASKVGKYEIVLEKGTVTNKDVTFINGTLQIDKAPLTITADNKQITLGDAMPNFTATYIGFKNKETESVLNRVPQFFCSASSNSDPGEYPIEVSGAEAENYSITFINGSLLIKHPDPVIAAISNPVAGNLATQIEKLGFSVLKINELKVTGLLNGTDIKCIREMIIKGSLTNLDIQQTSIVSGGEPYYNEWGLEMSTENDVVGQFMFDGCRNLISVKLPNTVKLIEYAFDDCDNLLRLDIPESRVEVGSWAISCCPSLTSIRIPEATKLFDPTNFLFCPSLTSIEVAPGNPWFEAVDGVLFVKDKSTLVKYPMGKNETTYHVPDEVKIIGDWAFSDAILTLIDLPEGLMEIGDGAFEGCEHLTSIELPSTLRTIEMSAFEECKNIDRLIIPEGIKEVPSFMASYCDRLSYVCIPHSVQEIGFTAFSPCKSLSRIDCFIDDIENVELEKDPDSEEVNVFENIPNDCEWHVLKGLKNLYLAQPWWVDSWILIDDLCIPVSSPKDSGSEPSDNVWYTIQGTRLNGKPQQQGIYLHGGKKVMIK